MFHNLGPLEGGRISGSGVQQHTAEEHAVLVGVECSTTQLSSMLY